MKREFTVVIERDEDGYFKIREYIRLNPVKWALDRENPLQTGENDFYNWLDSFKVVPKR